MFPWYVPIVVGSAAGFQCFNSALDVLPIAAPPGKYSGKERHRWRNASTSLFNSLLISAIVLYCLFNHPQIWTDPIGYYSVVADAGFAVMSGYVLYDTYDIFVHTDLFRKLGVVTHHIIIAVSFFMLSYETIGIGVLYIGLLTEIHSIFLHSRQLLIMYGVSKTSTVYSVHKSINLVTFLALRLVPLLYCCFCSYTMVSASYTILYYILPCFTAVMCLINLTLLWRLLRSDFLNTNGKDNHMILDDRG